MKIFTSTLVSICQFPPTTQHFYISFQFLYANTCKWDYSCLSSRSYFQNSTQNMSSFFFFFIFLLQLHSIPRQNLPGFIWLVPIFKHFVWVSIFFSVTNSILKFFCMVHKWICKKNYKSWTSRAKGIFAILIDIAKLFFNGCCNDLHSHQQHVNRPVFP